MRTGLFAVIFVAACSGVATEPANAHISGAVTAGPMCPVMQEGVPCPDQPVASAKILIIDGDGEVVAEVVTDVNGLYSVDLPPGSYQLMPQAAEGLMGTAAPAEVTIAANSTTVVEFSYDTGIR